jgi:hypothetical protein
MDRAAPASSWLRRSLPGSDAAIRLTRAAWASPDTAAAQGRGPGSSAREPADGWSPIAGYQRMCLWLVRSDRSRISWGAFLCLLAYGARLPGLVSFHGHLLRARWSMKWR